MEIRWNRIERPEWEALCANAPWQQHWAYGAAVEALGGLVHRADIRLEGQRIGIAQMTGRRLFGLVSVATCTRGPVWSGQAGAGERQAAYRALRASLPLRRPRGMFLTPEAPEAEAPALKGARLARVMSPWSTARIDLRPDEGTLRARLHQKWRNRLCRAEESRLRIEQPRDADWGWLLKAEAEQRKRRRYQAHPPALLPLWERHAPEGGGSMVLSARKGRETCAAMLFLIHGRGALYQIGWANETGRAANAHTLLLWQAMKRLRARGIETLDLGGVDTVDLPGIARFKLGSGAAPHTLCGTWH